MWSEVSRSGPSIFINGHPERVGVIFEYKQASGVHADKSPSRIPRILSKKSDFPGSESSNSTVVRRFRNSFWYWLYKHCDTLNVVGLNTYILSETFGERKGDIIEVLRRYVMTWVWMRLVLSGGSLLVATRYLSQMKRH